MVKVDVVMWTLNGQNTLPTVLGQIDKVIPKECVSQRITVDDGSTDNTVEVLESHGWKVYENRGKGISDAANTALSLVDSTFFCSFEQDILLSKSWWFHMCKLIHGNGVGVASGVRYPSVESLQKLYEYSYGRYFLRDKTFLVGKTLDNTVYNTKILRKIGGFPRLETNAGVDTVLAHHMERSGFKWLVDLECQSVHLRKGLVDELKHEAWYGEQLPKIWKCLRSEGFTDEGALKVFLYSLFSPFSGLKAAWATKCLSLSYVYPLIRAAYSFGLLKGVISCD